MEENDKEKTPEKMITEDEEQEREEGLLEGESQDDAESVSSSILNEGNAEEDGDKGADDDGNDDGGNDDGGNDDGGDDDGGDDGFVRVGILPAKYPQCQFTERQMQIVQDAILYNVTLQRNEQFKPKFTNCWQRYGCLVINCQDIQTAQWLDHLVPTLSPWEGADLVAIEASNIPRLEVLIGFFPQSVADDDQAIKVFIESQNDGLSTENWRVQDRKGYIAGLFNSFRNQNGPVILTTIQVQQILWSFL
ncbi:hypothetical protein quinque_014458 [Culex quinquefasciatus]